MDETNDICHDMYVLSFWGRVIYHLKLRQMHQFVLVWRSVELVAMALGSEHSIRAF